MLRKFLLILLLTLLPALAMAQQSIREDFDFSAFKALPIIHEGRVKPLGRMAQLTLRQISDVKLTQDEAAAWLAQLLFDPQAADTPAIFYVPQARLRYVLHLPDQQDHYYSFEDLSRAFLAQAGLVLDLRQSDVKSLSDDQQDLLNLYARVTYYEQLKGALTLVLPLKNKEKNFIGLYPDPSNTGLALLAQGRHNQSFPVIPHKNGWLSPWEEFLKLEHSTALLDLWAKAARAYIDGNATAWRDTTGTLYQVALQQAHQPLLETRLQTEMLYAQLPVFPASLACYALGLLAALLTTRKKPLLALGLLTAGLMLHGLGIAARMMILQRPPVSDLYESVLFIGFLLMAVGLGFIWRKKEYTLCLPLAFTGIALHVLGLSLNGEEDSLRVLQAVLDTKFWLATHVIIITAGYTLCLLTSVIAHICLIRNAREKLDLVRTKTFRQAYALSLVSLLLISVGTLLGGVWADQSWGRFWGWDPKENGALLIALWLVWLLHGKFSRDIDEFWFTTGLAALSIVVAMSWIGVNLLGIGLHSYGFMEGSMLSLGILILAELVFFGWCHWRRKNHG